MSRIIAMTSAGVFEFSHKSLLTIGGASSSGKRIPGLKYADDYVLVVPDQGGALVHSLKGKKKGPTPLRAGEMFTVEDLGIGFLPAQEIGETKSTSFLEDYEVCMQSFAGSENLTAPMEIVLDKLTASSSMEKGLIILKNAKDAYDLVVQRGIQSDDSWLSEKLVQQTLKSQRPLIIQNVIGSPFDGHHSLMASGFVSVAAWPLVVRGESLGVMLLGSIKPHSGLDEDQTKHFRNLAQLAALMLWFHLRDVKLKEELKALKQNQIEFDASPFSTSDPKLLSTVQLAKQVAPTKLSVVIHGETGVGKELLAKWIRNHSECRTGPFIAVNCGAIPAELLESLLFGHKKGAFTGAHNDQVGKFQAANNGTLFLDEIGDLPENLQGKLLRALQERVIEPLGSIRPVPVNVRIISASHKSLSNLVHQKKFREDLYFRLAEVALFIPPLRERPGDIGPLATEFLKTISPESRFSATAWSWLKSREWRGNGRELLSAVKRAALLGGKKEIEIADLVWGEPETQGAENSKQWLGGDTLEEAKSIFVRQKVDLALLQAGGQRTKAAELLGITPRTLFRYLEDKEGSATPLS